MQARYVRACKTYRPPPWRRGEDRQIGLRWRRSGFLDSPLRGNDDSERYGRHSGTALVNTGRQEPFSRSHWLLSSSTHAAQRHSRAGGNPGLFTTHARSCEPG